MNNELCKQFEESYVAVMKIANQIGLEFSKRYYGDHGDKNYGDSNGIEFDEQVGILSIAVEYGVTNMHGDVINCSHAYLTKEEFFGDYMLHIEKIIAEEEAFLQKQKASAEQEKQTRYNQYLLLKREFEQNEEGI